MVIKFNAEVIDIETIGSRTKTFSFKAPDDFSFEPGQFVNLGIEINGKFEKRAYSIASLPEEKGVIKLCINKVEKGLVSPKIHELKKGDKIELQGPLGIFKLKNNAKDNENVFIAAGTGIMPFVPMISSLLKKTKNKIMLFAGYRYKDEIICNEYFKELAQQHDNFEYYVVVSRDEKYEGDKGHVQVLIEKHLPKDFKGDFYICGLKNMVEDVKELLIKKNIPEGKIISEKYN